MGVAGGLPCGDSPLMQHLDWPDGVLSLGGDWRTSPRVLLALAREMKARPPHLVVQCGSGLMTLVAARMLQRTSRGLLHCLEHDGGALEDVEAALEHCGLASLVKIVEAPLEEYGRMSNWYDLDRVADLPSGADLLLLSGPPHFAGQNPAYPAGKELFPCLAPGAKILFDKANRAKEKRALKRWAREMPEWQQAPAGQTGATWLSRNET